MTSFRSLAEAVASVPPTRIEGQFCRHAAPNRDAFAGAAGGRWGQAFPVVYLARPTDSCVVEAYRHLVEDTGVPRELVRPRTLYIVEVAVGDVLDLRDRTALSRVGLDQEDLFSAVGDYAACQAVASAAHQLEYHGIIAPAATRVGETLALFRERVTAAEMPIILERLHWSALPPDPRRPRLVSEKDIDDVI